MPSTSAKQHRFMAAIAHSPSFAKKVGVSQSVGKDFNAADKGKTFNKGGMMKKRRFAMGGDTEGGYRGPDPADIPAQKYSEEQEKYLGGADRTDPYIIARMKKAVPDKAASFTRAPSDLGNIDFDAKEDAKPDAPATVNKYYSDDLPEASGGRGKPVATSAAPVRKPKASAQSTPSAPSTQETPAKKRMGYSDETTNQRADKGNFGETGGGAATGMASRKYKFKGTDEQKAENAEKFGDVAMTLMPLGVGAGLKAASAANKGLKTYRAGQLTGPKTNLLTGPKDSPRLSGPRDLPRLSGPRDLPRLSGPKKPIKGPSDKEYERMINEGEIAIKKGGIIKKRRFGDGGMMKESKAMAGKEMAFFKKKGAPKSMIKHEKAEMMGMNKFAKGGGIESHGKTKGTIVRMATGGSVSSASRRADGIAQRGKTRC
jgi:hypothetical protein